MKKIFTYLFSILGIISYSQNFVSTTPENKNVILEEYTGISCGYCPDGHKIGQQLHDNNPNDVFLINIHTGGYANPQGPGTDFNTQFGSALAGQTGLTGYPSGTVNRHVFAGNTNTALSRSAWSSNASQIMNQPSPVNVGIQSSIDMGTGTLTVDVEVYYTGNQSINTNKLNIAIVQSGILGPQSGGSTYNPAAIDPATGLYTHNHMLRHMLTGQWGETISNITQGTLYTNSYTWNIPTQISGYPLSPDVDPTQLSIVAFVAEDNQEILSGTEVYPTLVFPNAYDANLISSSATDIMCSPNTDLTINFKNYGNTNLTSLDIEYVINGGSVNVYPWTGNLSPGSSETVIIPNISMTSYNASNTVDVSLVNPNGNIDQNITNNNFSTTFAGMYDSPSGQITIEITTDNYPTETSWKLLENGVQVSQGGPFQNAGAPQTPSNVTINPGNCYTFIIEDSYGDGLLSPGSYKIKDPNGTVIYWGGTNSPNGNFTTDESTYFEVSSGVPQSWDCDNQGNCYDPGNGNGQYTSLSSCQSSCTFVSINDGELEEIKIFPIPVVNELNINGNFEDVKIYDIYGKVIIHSTDNKINTENLSEGIYLVNISTKDGIISKLITLTK